MELRLRIRRWWRRLRGRCELCNGTYGVGKGALYPSFCHFCRKRVLHGRNYGMSNERLMREIS